VLVALVRVVHDAGLAFDLATEATARARFEWDGSAGDRWLLDVAAMVLGDAAERGHVPSIERRRGGRPVPTLVLSAAEQQEIARLAEASLDLPPDLEQAFAAFVRDAPPPSRLRQIRPSGLVEPESLTVDERGRT
jgi:hypothetical protein